MLILKAEKADVIHQLKRFAAALNGGRVKKPVYKKFSRIYQMLSEHTMKDARYIECTEKELDTILGEYVDPIIAENHIVVSVYFGRQVSVYAKQRVEKAFGDAVAVYCFPSTMDTESIVIYLSYMDADSGELYDIDFAATLLRYEDEW